MMPAETLAAVLTRDVSLASLPTDTPSRPRALMRDCLIRDPKQRLRDIGHARVEIDKIIAGAPDDAFAPATATAARVPTWRRALPWTLAGAFALIAALLAWTAGQPPTAHALHCFRENAGNNVKFDWRRGWESSSTIRETPMNTGLFGLTLATSTI
jgi:hypothetical protein